MKAIEIATQMREGLAEHRRRTRYRGQEEYLEDKEALCRRLDAQLAELIRSLGASNERLTVWPGTIASGRRFVPVERRSPRRLLAG